MFIIIIIINVRQDDFSGRFPDRRNQSPKAFGERICVSMCVYTHVSLSIYIYIYIYTYMCLYIHTYVHTYIHTYIHTCMSCMSRMYTHADTYRCIDVCMHTVYMTLVDGFQTAGVGTRRWSAELVYSIL